MTGLVSATCFALLSISYSVAGIFAKAEHFVILFAVGGVLALVRAVNEDRRWLLFFGGLLLGAGFMMKQSGLAFVIFGGLKIVIHYIRRNQAVLPLFCCRFGLFVMGAILPYAITCLVYIAIGNRIR